jgi:hypothetical protein
MKSSASPRVEVKDMAGAYAHHQGETGRSGRVGLRISTEHPATNTLAKRDYAAEAEDATAIIENYIEREDNNSPLHPDFTKAIVSNKLTIKSALGFGLIPNEFADEFTAPVVEVFPDPQQVYFMSTAEWDGHVTRVNENDFEALIYPTGNVEEFREDTVTVPLQYVDDDVRDSVRVGAIFRFATGRVRRKRQIMHGVKVYFRRRESADQSTIVDMTALEALIDD